MAIKLSEMVKTGPSSEPPRICIYGPQAIGKTTFAAGAHKTIGLLTEDGIGNLDFPRVLCPDFTSLRAALDLLKSEAHEYKTVFIDSLDWLEQKILEHVCRENGKQNIEDFGYGKGWQFALREWSKLLADLDELRAKKRMVVVLVGHSIVKRFDPPSGESYDRYRLDLNEKAASLILDWLDILAFATYKTFIHKSEDGKRTIAEGDGERVMFLEERPAFWAKNRYSLPFELPLNFNNLIKEIRKGVKTNANTKEASTKAESEAVAANA